MKFNNLPRPGVLTPSFFLASLIVYFYTNNSLAGILAAIAVLDICIGSLIKSLFLRMASWSRKKQLRAWRELSSVEKETTLGEIRQRQGLTDMIVCFGCGINYEAERGELPYGWFKGDNIHYFCSRCEWTKETPHKRESIKPIGEKEI